MFDSDAMCDNISAASRARVLRPGETLAMAMGIDLKKIYNIIVRCGITRQITTGK